MDDLTAPKLSKKEEQAYQHFVHTPAEAHRSLYVYGEKIHGSRGISSGSKVLDKYMIETRAAWVRTWVAPPGCGKTTQLRAIAKAEANSIIERGLEDEYYAAMIIFEESVESHEIAFEPHRTYEASDFWRGKVKPEDIARSGMERATLPIYIIGESLLKTGVDTPLMIAETVIDALRAIYRIEGKRPSVLCWDYVQETNVENMSGMNRTEKVIQAMRDVMATALRLGAGVELGVQAKQTVLDRDPPLPGPNDYEYSFFPHQKTTNSVGLWRPWVTHRNDPMTKAIPINNIMYPISPNLVIASPLKHRPGILTGPVAYELDPNTLVITDLTDPYRQGP